MGKGASQRGATLVEAALVLPIMIMLMISLLELGMLFRDLLTVSYTAREAARVGSLAGNDPEADCDIMQSVVTAFGPTDVDGIDIHIFKASESTGNPEIGKTNTWTTDHRQTPPTVATGRCWSSGRAPRARSTSVTLSSSTSWGSPSSPSTTG